MTERQTAAAPKAVTVSVRWNDELSRAQSVSAELVARGSSGVTLRAARGPMVGVSAWVYEGSGPYLCAVTNRRYDGGDCLIDLSFLDLGRRRSERQIVLGGGEISWEDPAGGTRRCRAMVRNISDDGLQLGVSEPVQPGALVRLTGEEMECLAFARYCVADEHGYRIGLQFSRPPYQKAALDYQE